MSSPEGVWFVEGDEDSVEPLGYKITPVNAQ